MHSKGLFRGWVWLGVAALLLLVAACAPAQKPPAAAPAPAAPKVGAKYGGVFKWATLGKPESLDPYADMSLGGQQTVHDFYEGLLSYDYSVDDFRADQPLLPMLAESWKQPDEKTYIFNLRRGVKWHDGQPLTADDVVWSFEYLRDPKNAFQDSGLLRAVDKIEKVDDFTVRITTKAPSPTFLIQVADVQADVLPKHIFDKGGANALATAGVATGPFKLKKFDPTGKTVFVRNENYWGKDKEGNQLPYLDGMEITHAMDHPAQQAALAAREIDIYVVADKAGLDALLAAVKDLKFLTHYAHHSLSVLMNLNRKPYDDIRVRRAFHLAINRQELIQTAFGGEGILAHPAIPAIKKGWGISQEELLKLPGYRPDKTADIAEAKRLLTEAGHPNGFKTSMIYNNAWTEVSELPVVAAQLKKVGIDVELRGLDGASVMRAFQAGDFDTYYYLESNPNIELRLNQQFTSKAPMNSFGIKDAKIDELAEKLAITFDVAERKKLARELQSIFMEKQYTAPLIDVAAFRIWQPWVHNYYLSGSLNPNVEGSTAYLWVDLDKMPTKRK